MTKEDEVIDVITAEGKMKEKCRHEMFKHSKDENCNICPDEELKPCPFCGYPAGGIFEVPKGFKGQKIKYYRVSCSNVICCNGRKCVTKQEAIKAWNRRQNEW